MPAEESQEDIRRRVTFEIALRRLAGNHSSFSSLDFKGVELAHNPAWIKQLGDTLAKNDTIIELDLSGTGLNDAALQSLVATLACGAAPQLRVLNLCDNEVSLAGETVVQGLRKMRPALAVKLGGEPVREGFVHQKLLVEGLTAWAAETLAVEPGSSEFRCPPEITGSDAVVLLKKGFQGTNGTKYTCEDAEFEMAHSTGNMVLKSLEPEARLRLAARLPGVEV